MDRPPLPSPRTSRSRGSSSNGSNSRKAPRRGSSDSPSNSATNGNGRQVLDGKLRSVLSHPLGLSLLLAMNEIGTPELLRNHLPVLQDEKEGARFFGCVLDQCLLSEAVGKGEKALTEALVEKINELVKEKNDDIAPQNESSAFFAQGEETLNEPPLPKGRMDIVLIPEKCKDTKGRSTSTPLMVIEVGLHGQDWFKKLDQGTKYLKLMCRSQHENLVCFQEPLLFAVMTIDGEETQMGVFLCTRKDPNGSNDDFRMALLRQLKTTDRKKASLFFGRMLWLSKELQQLRKKSDDSPTSVEEAKKEKDGDDVEYEYFSSNCCRVGEHVIRIYDNRFRNTHKSPVVYLRCGDIVGETSRIVSLEHEGDKECIDGFNPPTERDGDPVLTIISTPYHKGGQVASKPSDFVPIIKQLHRLHEQGFVHGDIRAFNTVIGNDDEGANSRLIDFDFGGIVEKTKYPPGYRDTLPDGTRFGEEKEKIMKWHDWFALGHLIFAHYNLEPDEAVVDRLGRLYLQQKNWTNLDFLEKVGDKEVEELIGFLERAQREGWKIQPRAKLHKALHKSAGAGTYFGATGSPPKKLA